MDLGAGFSGSAASSNALNSAFNVTGGGGGGYNSKSASKPNWTLIILGGLGILGLVAWLVTRK